MVEQGRVIPEFGARPEDLQALNEAVAELAAHNAQFTPHTMLGRVFDIEVDAAETTIPDLETEASTLPLSEWAQSLTRPLLHEEQGMGRGVLGATNMDVLKSAGLTLGKPRMNLILVVQQRVETAGPVRMQLADGGVFREFLERAATHPKSIKDTYRGTIYAVTADIFFELSDHFGLGTEYPKIAEIMAYAGAIADGLEAYRDMDPELVQCFRECQAHTTTGTVREWVIADRLALFDNPDEQDSSAPVRSPAVLHRLMDVHEAAHIWDHVLMLLQDAVQIETGQTFYLRLLEAARNNLEFAEQDWRTRGGNESSDDGFIVLFSALRRELKRLGAYRESE